MMILRKCILSILLLFVFGSVIAQTRRALLIGISEYEQSGENSWTSIHGSNDVELIAPILRNQGFKTTIICNREAKAEKIRKAMTKLIDACVSGDIVYLHFSGHGQPIEDMNGDEEDGWDESIIPYDAQMIFEKGKYEGQNHITDDEIHAFIEKLRSKVGEEGYVCVVIDACHAGGSSRGDDDMEEVEDMAYVRGTKTGFSSNGKEFRPRINAKGNFSIPKGDRLANITFMEACRSYQSNYEIKQDGKYYGPLSYYVSQVLSVNDLSASLDWILEVKKKMDSDRRLSRQNMVYETSLE